MKKHLLLGLTLAAAMLATGCQPSYDNVQLEKCNVPVGYNAVYHITAYNGEIVSLEYDNRYSVQPSPDGTVLTVTSNAEAAYDGKDVGVQTITAVSTLEWTDGEALGRPENVEQEYSVSTDESKHTKLAVKHDHRLMRGTITTSMYASSDDREMTQHVYTFSLAGQYYDKDSFPFLANGLVGDDKESLTLLLSAGNRDKLQSVNFRVLGEEDLETEAGAFHCVKVRLRPNTLFTSYSSEIWLDRETGVPVRIQQGDTVSQLIELTF